MSIFGQIACPHLVLDLQQPRIFCANALGEFRDALHATFTVTPKDALPVSYVRLGSNFIAFRM